MISKVESEVQNLGADTLRRCRDHTRLSPLSLVILGGRPAGSACSKIAVSPFRAASYMRLANAIISGESAVGGTPESAISALGGYDIWKALNRISILTFYKNSRRVTTRSKARRLGFRRILGI